jgi:hypothetical protein
MPSTQLRASLTNGTVVERRPPKMKASIGTPLGSSQALSSAGLLVAGLMVMPLDPAIAGWFDTLPKRGDFWREIEAWQQYGQGGAMILGGVLIWLLDPGRRRRLLDWAAAAGAAWVCVFLIKVLVGRPRPRLGEPYGFLWPWGTWDFGPPGGERPRLADPQGDRE